MPASNGAVKAVQRLTAEMRRTGVRRLCVISGDADWVEQQAQCWRRTLTGDWLWIGDEPPAGFINVCSPNSLSLLLGRETQQVVFDARTGFHTEAFAAAVGMVKAGSWLLLLAPEWQRWPQQHDDDTRRWGESGASFSTPHFVRYFQHMLRSDPHIILWRQGKTSRLTSLPQWPTWRPGAATEQQTLLQQLCSSGPGIHVLTAARGRGKSALAGLLARYWPGRCVITAPAKVSVTVLAAYAGDAFHFVSPDNLLMQSPLNADWLLIDEAAAIPLPQLLKLIKCCPRVLLSTTVQGYEGTGRGFLLKFCASLPQVTWHTLNEPLRWSANDPLESFVSRTLLFDETIAEPMPDRVRLTTLTQTAWTSASSPLADVYRLLTAAHYRTSPLDLRRMMDAPGMHFIAAVTSRKVTAGALWLVEEGGLDAMLACAIWAGIRRPRGNLVAQSLAAHAGFPEAAQWRSCRISRIAVLPTWRRQGLGRKLVTFARQRMNDVDFLSVSFGYTAELWRFWQRCGFHLVRFGSQREAASGCYTAMALLPLSARGRALVRRAEHRLQRDACWLQPQIEAPLPLTVQQAEQTLSAEDWKELSGFAFAQRSFAVSRPALSRLLCHVMIKLPALEAALKRNQLPADICRAMALNGRKALQARWRQETGQALYSLDAPRAQCWHRRLRRLRLCADRKRNTGA